MIGKRLNPILLEIELVLFEFELNNSTQPHFTDDGFRAAIKIFMSALMDKMWNLQHDESIDMEDRVNMAQKAGEDLRQLIKTYTDIDTYKLYK